jgi:diguanylate cyclase (GGDEF)-like protein
MVDEQTVSSSENESLRPTKKQIEEVKNELDGMSHDQIIESYAILKVNNLKLEKDNEDLRNISGIDHLTGLADRRGLLARFESIVNILKRQKSEKKGAIGFELYSVIFLDLVGLKDINDNISYKEGDKTIEKGADIINKSAQRETDIVSRWGGDEYVVVLVNTDENGALKMVNKINDNLKEGVKFSAVVGEFSKDVDILDAINEASNVLKDAKRIGLKDEKDRSLGIGLVTLDKNEK